MRFPDKFRISSGKNPYNRFDLSGDQVTTANFMVPKISYIKEMVPGDKFDVRMESFVRMMPMLTPSFGRVNIYNRFFFVPMRTIVDHWYDFINQTPFNKSGTIFTQTKVPYFKNSDIVDFFLSGGPSSNFYTRTAQSGETADFTIIYGSQPQTGYIFTNNGRKMYDIFVNLGYNINWSEDDKRELSALPLLAYLRVIIDYYRPSQYADTAYRLFQLFDLAASDPHIILANVSLDDILYRCVYDPDYFVSAWDKPSSPNGTNVISPNRIEDVDNNGSYYSVVSPNGQNNNTPALRGVGSAGSNPGANVFAPSSYILHILDKVSDYVKRHQIAGYRSVDRFFAQFGIKLDDVRSRRSQHIHTDEYNVRISDVVSTADTSNAPIAYQAGKGLAYTNGKDFTFESGNEHGYLICITTIVPKIGYYQGTRKDNLHLAPLDFYTSDFDGCGTQAIALQELFSCSHHDTYFNGMVTNGYGPDSVFGFCPRFTEYKIGNDVLSGDFRLPALNTLLNPYQLFRTVGEEYATLFQTASQALYNHDIGFVTGSDANQYNRIFNVTDGTVDNFILINHCEVHARRAMLSIIDGVEFYDKGHNESKDITVSNNGQTLN